MAINLPDIYSMGYGGTPKGNPQNIQRGGGTKPASTAKPSTTTTTPFNAAMFQAQPTMMPQYTSGAWAGLPTGVLGSLPATQPTPATPTPAIPAPSTGGGGVLGNPHMTQMIQRYPGLAQYFHGRNSSPLGSLFGGLFGRRA